MWPPRSRTACRSLPPEGAAAPAGWRSQTRGPGCSGSMPPRSRTVCRSRGLAGRGSRDASPLSPVQSCSSSFGAAGSSPSGTAAPAGWRSQTRGYEKSPRGRALRVAPEALQASARETLRLCRLSKAAQAALEPQAPAPRGPLHLRAGEARPAAMKRAPTVAHCVSIPAPRGDRCACGLAKPDPRPLLVWIDAPTVTTCPTRGPLRLRAGERVRMQRAHHATGDALLMQRR